MSSTISLPAAEAIELLTKTYITNCCYAAVAVLAVYEHIITFDHEVLAIWQYRVTGVTILLLFNRYALLLSAISNVLETFNWTSDQFCEAQYVLYEATYVLSIVIAAVFSALRVYAIARRNWYWMLLALLTGLIPAANNIYLFISESHPSVVYLFGIPQCVQPNHLSNSAFDKLLITTRTFAIVSDLIVIVATWIYARPWANHVSDTQVMTPLMLVVVRDGTGYFIVFLILNIAQVAIEQGSNSESRTFNSDYMTVFIPVISSILISRFMFNLRKHIDQGNSAGSNVPTFVAGSMGSRENIELGSRLIGNMGAPLDHRISDSLSFDDGDEPHEDDGCNEVLNKRTVFWPISKTEGKDRMQSMSASLQHLEPARTGY